MTNSRISESHLRTLIEKWYEGTNTPEEEQAIMSWFAMTPEDEIPEDLAEERLIFSAIHYLPPAPHEAEAAIDQVLGLSAVHKHRRYRIAAWQGIAAAVAVMLLTITCVLFNNKPATPSLTAHRQLPPTAGITPAPQPQAAQKPSKADNVSEPSKPLVAKERRTTKAHRTSEIHHDDIVEPDLTVYGYTPLSPNQAASVANESITKLCDVVACTNCTADDAIGTASTSAPQIALDAIETGTQNIHESTERAITILTQINI